MPKARACILVSLVVALVLASHVSHAVPRGLEFPIGDLETVMAKRGAVAEGFALTAWLPRATYAPGEDIQLWLTLQNVSNGVLSFPRSLPELDFPLVVREVTGGTLWPKTHDRLASWLEVELKPGDGLVRNYLLQRLYDLSAPGTYHITATARVQRHDGNGWTDVVAPTVTLTVSEAAPAEGHPGILLFGDQRLSLAEVNALMDRKAIPSRGLRLTAELLKASLRPSPGEQVVMKVTLHNLSEANLSCWDTSHESNTDVDYIVEGPRGVALPKRAPRRVPVGGRLIAVPPGEALTRYFRVASFYDFSMPGEYRITAVRRMPTPDGWAYVVSNTEVLTVEPPR